MLNKLSSQEYRFQLKTRKSLFSLETAAWFLAFNTLFLGLTKSGYSSYFNFHYVAAPFLFVGMVALLRSIFIQYKATTYPFRGKYVRAVFFLLITWGLVTIARDLSIDFPTIRDLFGIRLFGWVWVMPLCMILGTRIEVWGTLLRVIVQHGKFAVFILIFGYFLSFFTTFNFTWGCPAALLFWHYLPSRWKRVVLLGAFLSLFFAVLSATRNQVLGVGILMFFALFVHFYRWSPKRLKGRVAILLGCFVFFTFVTYVDSTGEIPFASSKINQKISVFQNKLYINTRVSDTHNIYQEFLDDVQDLDFYIGRGALGTYFGEVGASRDIVGYRRTAIECGYFQVILKGGVVMLTLMLALALPAMYLGFFRTRNWFSRSCAFIVLGWLIEMVPYGLPAAHLNYALFWLAIGACWSPGIRSLADSDIIFHANHRFVGVHAEGG